MLAKSFWCLMALPGWEQVGALIKPASLTEHCYCVPFPSSAPRMERWPVRDPILSPPSSSLPHSLPNNSS